MMDAPSPLPSAERGLRARRREGTQDVDDIASY